MGAELRDAPEALPRAMALERPLLLRISHWAEAQGSGWVDAGARRLPIGPEVLIERSEFDTSPRPGLRRLVPGGPRARLRFACWVACEDYLEEAGEVVEVVCRCEFPQAGKVPNGAYLLNWVHASRHESLRIDGAAGLLACEFGFADRLLAGHGAVRVELERLGIAECSWDAQSGSASGRWLSRRAAPQPKAPPEAARLRGQRAREARKLALAPGGGSGSAQIDDLAVSAPLLLICASERWISLMTLEVREAWRAAGRDPSALRPLAQGLLCDVGGAPQADAHAEAFLPSCPTHVAGLRARLRALCAPARSAAELVAAAQGAGLSFPQGFSLRLEGPCPARPEATAPYASSSGFLAAALSRAISGPLLEEGQPPQPGGDAQAHLVAIHTVGPSRFILAQEEPLFQSHAFSPAAFCGLWRSRPFPDYSAALEPLAALALVTLGVRAHAGSPIAACLDPCCGTGTVAAAAWYCLGAAGCRVLAGDVSEKMSRRTAANLEKSFGRCGVYRGDDEAGEELSGDAEIEVRNWDATRRWPMPELDHLGTDGEGLLVVANLPWGGNLRSQEDDATGILRCLLREFPRATLSVILPDTALEACVGAGAVRVLHTAPAGNKKCSLLVGTGCGTVV